jgi:hypothetical protein
MPVNVIKGPRGYSIKIKKVKKATLLTFAVGKGRE